MESEISTEHHGHFRPPPHLVWQWKKVMYNRVTIVSLINGGGALINFYHFSIYLGTFIWVEKSTEEGGGQFSKN